MCGISIWRHQILQCKLYRHISIFQYSPFQIDMPYVRFCIQRRKQRKADHYNFLSLPYKTAVTTVQISLYPSMDNFQNKAIDFNKVSHLFMSSLVDRKEHLHFTTEPNSPHSYVLRYDHEPCQEQINRMPWDLNHHGHSDMVQCSITFKQVESSGWKNNCLEIKVLPSLSENDYTQSFLGYWLSQLKPPSPNVLPQIKRSQLISLLPVNHRCVKCITSPWWRNWGRDVQRMLEGQDFSKQLITYMLVLTTYATMLNGHWNYWHWFKHCYMIVTQWCMQRKVYFSKFFSHVNQLNF